MDTVALAPAANRSRFISMASTYFLGVFNDNFFKQTALLLAVTAGLSQLQGTATILFALPFILFSAHGGWLADRFPKRNIIIATKGLELAAMLIGAAGLLFTNWACILCMVFLMGLQSTLFSPALNGSIPELYPAEAVVKVNSRLKTATTIAILLGIASAGILLDQQWLPLPGVAAGQALIGLAVVLVAIAGLLASLKIPVTGNETRRSPFPWRGPLQSIYNLRSFRHDRELLLAITGDAFFYFISSLTLLAINSLALNQLGLSKSAASLQSVALMAGVCLGAFFAARRLTPARWTAALVPGSLGMALGLLLAGLAPLAPVAFQGWFLGLALTATGVAGGYFLIPISSFIQVRPAATDKGRVIATSNFCGFTGILLAGQLYILLGAGLSPAGLMTLLGMVTLVASFSFLLALRWKSGKSINTLLLVMQQLLRLRYRISVKGLDALKKKEGESILFLPNHPALIDPVILTTLLYNDFRPRPFSDQEQTDIPVVRAILRKLNFIAIPSLIKNGRQSKDEVMNGINLVVEGLERGDNIILYPAGRLYRSKFESLGGKSGVASILEKRQQQRIVLVRTHGLWGSSFGTAQGMPSVFKYLGRYLLALLAGGLFFVPKRRVTVEFEEALDFPRQADKLQINRYLEGFYNENAPAMTSVPYFRFQGPVRELPEPENGKAETDCTTISAAVKMQVDAKIEEFSGAANIEPLHGLMQEIGLDSLNIVELAGWIEEQFHTGPVDPETLLTVGDCYRQASGSAKTDAQLRPAVDKRWFANASSSPLRLPAGASIAELFLEQAAWNPDRAILADQLSGTVTYRRLIMMIEMLKPAIEKLPGDRIGIMLPASVSASALYLATIFSGKTPVMLNWTTGVKNLRHCLQIAGVRHLFTAKALTDKLAKQGQDLAGFTVQQHYLEELRGRMGKLQMLKALVSSYLPWSGLRRVKVSDTAAILFTSGSEALPKAVPLSHANILANLQSFTKAISFNGDDRLLGILPPFHSLGLTGTMVMPLCLGLKTSYQPDPTRGAVLAGMIEAYRSTMLISTPTFLANILKNSGPGQLESLRLVFTGAEKCPDPLHEALAVRRPGAVIAEGYGTTECAPLISVNPASNPRRGTIGRVLPGIEHRLVHPDSGLPVARGVAGILLVRGANVFAGYLGHDSATPFTELDGKLWYNTGDLVREDEEGFLTFCGRKKRFVKIGGEMVSLPAIESALASLAADASGNGPALAVEAAPDSEQVRIVLFTTVDLEREAANRLLRDAGLSPLHKIHQLVRLDAIPVLGTGKTDYRQLQSCLAAS